MKKNTYKPLAELTGVTTVSDFNRRVEMDDIHDVINVTEVVQARQIADMADEILERGTVRVVLIAGPSSSGKTTFSKRLSVQLMAVGLKPITLSTDDYFVPRHLTPKDEEGNYDFESLYAVELELFNEQLKALTAGEEVRLPRFNFETGLREWRSNSLTCSPDTVLIIEGIHALNPLLTESVEEDAKYKIFCSVLSDVMLDEQRSIPTTENRLLRRILRDSQYRGFPAAETIRLWPSVRRGEEKWITPFIGEADVLFDSSFLYELAVMKNKLKPILQEVHKTSAEYDTAQRLLGYIDFFKAIPDKAIPPTSLLREFFGGSSYHY
jgi:uridine kinase